LRDHLRADEDVDLAVTEPGQQRGERALAADGVTVEARDARAAGTQALQFRFDALGAEAGLLEIATGAKRACGRHARGVVAVVAARTAGPSVAVHDERHAAVRAVDGARALAAEHRRRKTAPVEEHEGILVAPQ